MAELDGKGRRVAGFFIAMLGAGLVLESAAVWYGGGIMALGTVLFVWGIVSGREQPQAR